MDNIYTKSDELFYYLKVNSESDFPSIQSTVETLFRVTPYSITRVVTDGSIVVNDSTHAINPISADLSHDDSVYLCNKKKMVCERRNSCNTKTYILDDISKKRTLKYLNKSVINDNNQKNLIKLKDSLIINPSSKTVSNIFSSQFYMTSPLGSIELNEDELNLLIDTFCKDLFNDKITDMEQKEDNLNLLANVIKELHEENQNKVMQKLENKPEAKDKQDLIDDLRDRILKLKLLKDDLKDEKFDNSLIDHNKTIDFENKNEDDLLENNEDNDETVVVEITMNDIGQEDLKDICDVFLLDLEDNKEKEKEKDKDKEREKRKKKFITKSTKNLKFLANSLIKMDDKVQKKITENLEKNVRNENEKLQLKELMDKVYELNLIKKIGKEIKKKIKTKKVAFKDEIQKSEELKDNTQKNLEK